jgi:tetratricopeptide (TPR) repeat protein
VAGSDRSRRLEDALEAARRGDLRRAAQAYRELLADSPNDPGLLQRLGDALARAGDLRAARAAFVRLAKLYRKGADDRRAIAALNRAAQLGQPDPEVLEQLGDLLVGVGRAADARAPWTNAVRAAQHAGDADRVWRLAAKLLDIDPHSQEWLEAARRAAALLDDRSSRTVRIWLELAERAGRAGSGDVVEEALRRALRADPAGAALSRRAGALSRAIARGGAGERAVAVCRQAARAGAPEASLLAARVAIAGGVIPLAADLALEATVDADRLSTEGRTQATDVLGAIVSRDPSRGDVLERLERLSGPAPAPAPPPEPGASTPPPSEPAPASGPRVREAPAAPSEPAPLAAEPASWAPDPADDWIVFLEEEEDTAPVSEGEPEQEDGEVAEASSYAERAKAEDRADEATLDRLGGELREAVEGHDDETTYQMAVGLLEMGLEDQAVDLLDPLLDRPPRALDAAVITVRVLRERGEAGPALKAGERALAAGDPSTETGRLLSEELEQLRQAVQSGGG